MKLRLTYVLAALLCAILSMVSCVYDEHVDVVEGPGLIFRVRTQSSTKVSYDGGLFSTAFENNDVVGCVIAEKSGEDYTFMSNTKWAFQNGVLMLQDAENAYIKKVEDSAKAAEGYVELAGNLAAYSFFFYYPYVDETPDADFPKSGESFLVQQALASNWTDFPLFVNLEQTTKGKVNCSDFMWVGYTMDQKSGNDITMSNANYPVNLEFRKKTATIEVLSDAPITNVLLKTTVPATGDPSPISRGCSIDLRTGEMGDLQTITSEEGFQLFDIVESSERFRLLLPAQTGFSATLSFTLNEKSYSANLSNLTVLEEGKLYIIYIASDDGSIIINDWMDGGYSDLEEILPGQIVVTEMTAERFKAGYTVTIRGEELGETASVRMSGASITEFTVNGDGTVLTFVIPDTAKDGQVVLVSDSASESVAGEVTLVKPSEVALTPSSIKPGETLTITGNDLDLVKGVTFGGDVYVDVTSTETEIRVTVPASAVTGNIMLELKNGTSIEGGVLTVLQPSVTSMTADRFKAGNVVTITGANLDMVKSVVLPGSGEVAMSSHTAETITFTLPELAQDGQIVLVNEQDGEIVSDKCVLTLVKPSKISYAPADLEAGQEMTISGADLDLVKSITFADETTVEVTSTETQIVVTIPVSAVSGALTFNLKNGTQFNAPELTLVQPEVTSVSGKHKDGETITIVGTHFAMVAKVKISGTEVGFTYDGNNTITFVVPDNTPDGDIILLTAMGAEVDGGDYVTVIPTNLATDPSSVKLGSSFSITGNDLDLVTAISIPGSGSLTASDWSYADGKIMVNALPETAVDGDIVLTTKSIDVQGNYKTASLTCTLVKPVVTSYSPSDGVAVGGTLTIYGTDLDLIRGVIFNGDSNPVAPDEGGSDTSITVTVPVAAVSGNLKLVLVNGATIEINNLIVRGNPDITSITRDASNIYVNGSDLNIATAVKINGSILATDRYLVNADGSQIVISMTASDLATSGISGNISVENNVVDTMTYDFTPSVTSFDKTTVSVGETVTLSGANLDLVSSVSFTGSTSFDVQSPSYSTLSFVVPEGTQTGNITLSCLDSTTTVTPGSITIKEAGSEEETVLWTGERILVGNVELGSDNDFWINNNLQTQDRVRLYFKKSDNANCRIKIFSGHWTELFDIENPSGDYYEFVVTDELLSKMTEKLNWGFALILQGTNNVTVTQLSIIR